MPWQPSSVMPSPLLLAGRRYDDPRDAVEELQRELHQFARSGIGQYALSGVDIALWDLAGKMQGRSVAALLGGPKRSRIPAMASLLRYEAPADVARATESWLAAGFGSTKLHQTTSSRSGRPSPLPAIPGVWRST